MTHIWPCNRCPLRIGCEQREVYRRKVAGLGLITARFGCDRLTKELRLGRRVVITRPLIIDFDRDDGHAIVKQVEVAATINNPADAQQQFGCVVDPPADPETTDERRFRFRRRMKHSRIVRFLDEPDALLCNQGNVQRKTGCETMHGDGPAFCNCKQMATPND